FHFRIIPNSLNIIIGVCGLLFLLLVGEGMWLGIAVSAALLCVGLFLAVVYSSLRKREMLGLGDVKFFAAAGVWLDPFTASLFLGLGGIIGLIFNLLWRRISQDVQFPFGPALCISFVICIIYRLTG
ncbi:MAG: prepilin peptidase, partial [Alphaproteobacteria bacterium]|nr:prepilin peptidase [Alphaproteobacteria bacterium]